MKRLQAKTILVSALALLVLVVFVPSSSGYPPDPPIPHWWGYRWGLLISHGPYPDHDHICRGASAITPSYSSMSNYQGKVNSVYVMHRSGSGVSNMTEGGWAWLKPDWGNAPVMFIAQMKNGLYDHTVPGWFTPGAENRYTIRYIAQESDGSQRWGLWVNGVWRVSKSWTYLVDGWASLGGERTSGQGGTVWCSGNAEFKQCRKYKGGDWRYWDHWGSAYWAYWPWQIGDPEFKFVKKSSTVTEYWIRPR